MQNIRDAVTVASLALVGILTAIVVSVHGATAEPNSQAKINRLMEQLGNLEFGLGATGIVQGTLNNDTNNPDDGGNPGCDVVNRLRDRGAHWETGPGLYAHRGWTRRRADQRSGGRGFVLWHQ